LMSAANNSTSPSPVTRRKSSAQPPANSTPCATGSKNKAFTR
jgi:hypothetical protein